MLQATEQITAMLDSPFKKFEGRVGLYNGSTLETLCTCHDYLSKFIVERIGAHNKFFGFGVCQKLIVDLIDLERALNVTKQHNIKVELGVNRDYISPCPVFYIEEVTRDEATNEIHITAYDALYKANNHTVSELVLETPYTIKTFVEACAALLNLPSAILNVSDQSFNLSFIEGANFDGSESIRAALDAVAEATQTIYYIDSLGRLVFRRVDKTGAPLFTVDRENYFALESGEARTLATITHATELGDNVTATTGAQGVTQFVRDNPFWELRADAATLIDNALQVAGGLTIGQFTCSDWAGNFLLEIGDKIGFEAENGDTIISYVFDDSFTFDGTLSQATQWSYTEDEAETESNPTSLGDALNRTFARVDKVNNQIQIVAAETSENARAVSNLQLTTDSISLSVDSVENALNEEISKLQTKIEQTATELNISIQEVKNKDINEVTTTTGFTFNNEGLTIDKSDSEIKTTITEDGMTIRKDSEAVLTANNVGVNATNLHATTYLIVGANSRFENYNENRTGCFWIR